MRMDEKNDDNKSGSSSTSAIYDSAELLSRQLELDPCYKESQMSLRCLRDNDYVRERCIVHFENYKACKSFWLRVKMKRLSGGLRPLLPPPEDREDIKRLFRETGKVPATPKG